MELIQLKLSLLVKVDYIQQVVDILLVLNLMDLLQCMLIIMKLVDLVKHLINHKDLLVLELNKVVMLLFKMIVVLYSGQLILLIKVNSLSQ